MEVGSIEYIATINTARYKSGARDIEKANREMEGSTNRADKSTNKLNDSLSKMAKAGMVAVAAGATAAGAAIAGMAVASVKSFAKLEQSVGGSEIVFNGFSKTVQDMAKNSATVMGTSMNQYLETANKMGSLFQGAGFTVRDSLEMSNKTMQRATDVATAMGISTESALESIAGAAKGNFTMMDNLGVAMNDTTLEAYRLEKGLSKAVSKMTTTEKVGLAMEMFLDRTAKLAGNYARENDTLSGSFTTLRATWDNFLSGVDGSGEELGRSLAGVVKVLGRELPGVLQRLRSGAFAFYGELRRTSPEFKQFSDVVESAVKVAVKVGEAIYKVGKFLYDMRVPLIAITAAWAAYRVVIIASNAVMAIQSALMYTAGTRMLAYNGSIIAVRGAVTAATVAQAAWNAVLLLNPIGLVAAAVVGLTAALYLLSSGTGRLTAEEKYLNDTRTKSIEISNRVRDAENALKDSRNEAARADIALERAERNLAEAVKNYGEKSLEAREAQLDLDEAKARAEKSNDNLKRNTQELTEAQRQQRDMVQDIINKLDSLNGKSIQYTMNGTNMVASKQSDGNTYLMPEFANGGYTGAGGKHEPRGIVHGGEYVFRKNQVDQSTGRPKLSALADMMGEASSGGGIVNNIQNVTISSEVDGERWLRRLSGNQEIVSNGLVPAQSYM